MVTTFVSTFVRDKYAYESGDPAGRSYISVEDAGKRLAYSPDGVRKLIERGLLDAYVVLIRGRGPEIVVTESSVQEFAVNRWLIEC